MVLARYLPLLVYQSISFSLNIDMGTLFEMLRLSLKSSRQIPCASCWSLYVAFLPSLATDLLSHCSTLLFMLQASSDTLLRGGNDLRLILLAACQQNELSSELPLTDGEYGGAFTYLLLRQIDAVKAQAKREHTDLPTQLARLSNKLVPPLQLSCVFWILFRRLTYSEQSLPWQSQLFGICQSHSCFLKVGTCGLQNFISHVYQNLTAEYG